MKRKNKTKQEIVQDLKLIEETKRKRKIVKDVVYPFLLELNNTIGYTKIFLQTIATALETAFHKKQKEMKVSEFIPQIKEVFGKEEKYVRLLEVLKDETVYDFLTLIQVMPRVIEGYYTKEVDKNPIMELPIDKILG